MILLISTCSEKLSEEEFVKPISKIIQQKHEIKNYSENIEYSKYEKILICGTALKDNEYINDLEKFDWIKDYNNPIFGICSGMQVIALSFGAKLTKNKDIGMLKIKTTKENRLISGEFYAYELHGNGLSKLDKFEILAKSDKSVQAIKLKKKEIYGIMFHPEVRNQDIIRTFLNLDTGGLS